MYLGNQFLEIPDVGSLDGTHQSLVRVKFDNLLDSVLSRVVSETLYDKYTCDKGLTGIVLWQALYKDFGQMTLKQQQVLKKALFKKFYDSTVSLSEKCDVLESADFDILPLPEQKKFMFYLLKF